MINDKSLKIGQQVSAQHRERIRNIIRSNFHRCPLISSTFEKFWVVSHESMHLHTKQLEEVLENTCLDDVEDQDHDDLITDLFYLSYEHENFKVPRKVAFKKNQSSYTACFVSLVAEDIMPNQLCYWMRFMNEQDKTLVYEGISAPGLWSQTWINHQGLREMLVEDFRTLEGAASALKQIIGFKRLHPQKMKTKGNNLANHLISLFFTIKQEKLTLFPQHLEIAVWVIANEEIQLQKMYLAQIFKEVVNKYPSKVSRLCLIWIKQLRKKGQTFISEQLFEDMEKMLKENQLKIISE